MAVLDKVGFVNICSELIWVNLT